MITPRRRRSGGRWIVGLVARLSLIVFSGLDTDWKGRNGLRSKVVRARFIG
jgi:hypothetical protein